MGADDDSATPLAPLPDHRRAATAWWQELWRRHAHITTPLRQRGLECDIEFGLSAYMVRASLPDGSYLIISPPQEPPSSRPPGDPEGWSVTRQHPDTNEQFELVYDSTPSADPGVPYRPEVRNGADVPPMIEAIDARFTQLGVRIRDLDDVHPRVTDRGPTQVGDGSRRDRITHGTAHDCHVSAAVDGINQHRSGERFTATVRAPTPPTAGPPLHTPVSR
ncbi:hypothetical protein ACFZDJ_13845 [Streptomyces sp. NPDC007896]|uniref:hypothetical protein n=1 Tax=Streptomyces sp. NPDC007896 TaxID=3364784 RepID=UPI0036E0F147